MHVLSDVNRSEFLACPQLVKVDHAQGERGLEPTLLIKGTTLLLKFILAGAPIQFIASRLEDRLLYGLRVEEEPGRPAILWSVLERLEERDALMALECIGRCPCFLFNELAINVAWSDVLVAFPSTTASHFALAASLGPVDYPALSTKVEEALDRLMSGEDSGFLIVPVEVQTGWYKVNNVLVTKQATASRIDIFSNDEGIEQEQLAVWLTDKLHPNGAHHSPKVPGGTSKRELTDVLLTYPNGSFLIESKALKTLSGTSIRSKKRLSNAVSQHVAKALRQLQGAIKELRSGREITSSWGAVIEVERVNPVHAIILIPDLDLLENDAVPSLKDVRDFMERTGGYLHLLDISELMRMVQAAEMIAARENNITLMMAFDYYLMERAKKIMETSTLKFSMLLHMV